MPEEFQPSQNAYVIGALITTLLGLCLSFLLAHLLRKRLGEIKTFIGPLVVGHVIAYGLFLYSWKPEAINDATLRAGLIVLSVIPAFIVASAMGRQRKPKEHSAENHKEKKALEKDTRPPETDKTDKETPGIPPEEKTPDFSEGLIKGLWAFASIWVFYILYMALFIILVSVSQSLVPSG